MRLVPLIIVSSAIAWGAEPGPLTLTVGRGVVVDCPGGVARVSTSNPDAVDAVVAGESEVLFHAKAIGQGTLFVWSKGGARHAFEVTVEPNLEPVRALLRATFPGQAIDVRPNRDSLALVGRAATQAIADQALALVSASYKGAVSALEIPPPPPDRQVLLKVRFAELNRSVASEFGVNLFSTGAAHTPGSVSTGQFPSATIDPSSNTAASSTLSLSDVLNIFAFRPDLNLGIVIRDLQSRGLLQILAEPNLVATNGKEASFLAGGEFPVPVVQAGASSGAVTVMFREFGIRLSFLPQLTAHGAVRLHVRPEVSTIDPANGITVSGFRIPALSTRRVETDIELAPGQSFAIAGLLDDRVIDNFSRLPGFANIPLIGALFRSRSQTKAKTELLVVVTPEEAWPAASPDPGPAMPTRFLGPATPAKGGK